jgi:hypothetical protein
VSSTEPSRELPAKVSSTEDGQRASGRGIADREVAETDICKGPEIGNNFKIDSESRIEEAHVNLWPVEDEPVTPLLRSGDPANFPSALTGAAPI